MTKPSTFTPEQDAAIIRMKADGYGKADIGLAIDKKAAQVETRWDFLRPPIQRPEMYQTPGWPIHDPRKVNDWPDFSTQNVKLPPSQPRYLQPPVRHSAGVAPYG